MPPGHKPPTTRRWIFFEREVVEWLRSGTDKTKATLPEHEMQKRIGRPRSVELGTGGRMAHVPGGRAVGIASTDEEPKSAGRKERPRREASPLANVLHAARARS
jgi:hypothetical protein